MARTLHVGRAHGRGTEWRSGEIVAQVLATRDQPGVDGEVHFSMESFLSDRDSVGTVLRRTVYAAARARTGVALDDGRIARERR